ncbi:MAG: hypothetical protein F6K24_24405, partial [Okeania sp. SIO2D1]|nr:hypothetical protein [Okeania sp. SIO2D1]
LTAAAIAYHFLTKYVEKAGEGLSEKTFKQTGKLWQRVKGMPGNTFRALKPAQENPFPEDFGEAIRELEAVANQNPEFKQDIIDVVAVAKEEYPEYVKNLEAKLEKIKSRGITAKRINALFEESTITADNVGNTGIVGNKSNTGIFGNKNVKIKEFKF